MAPQQVHRALKAGDLLAAHGDIQGSLTGHRWGTLGYTSDFHFLGTLVGPMGPLGFLLMTS